MVEAPPYEATSIAEDRRSLDGSQRSSGAKKIRTGVGGFLRDALELCELQGLLLGEDLRKAKTSLVMGTVFLGAAAVLGLSVVTVLLFAIGEGVSASTGWPGWLGHLAAAGVALVVLAAAAAVGGWMLIRATKPLARSAAELRTNWAAVKTAVARTSPHDDYETYEDHLRSLRDGDPHR